jgi:hypothetical protein
MVMSPSGTILPLAQSGKIGIVFDKDWYSESAGQTFAKWKIHPLWDIWCGEDDARHRVKRTRAGYRYSGHISTRRPNRLHLLRQPFKYTLPIQGVGCERVDVSQDT